MTRDQAWAQIIASPLVNLNLAVNRLTSAHFKALGQEPRLMTKFDARGARPKALRDHDLFLLPETNGSYLLLREDGYCDLPTPKASEISDFEARFPFPLVSLRDATSEMSQLDRLFQCKLIERIIGTDQIFATIRGRRFAPHFDYSVGKLGPFAASGIQYEIDQGYETRDEIILFEAKNTIPDNFLIRQVYFPFRVYLNRFGKRIRLFFFNYNATNGVNSFYEYHFTDPLQYRSIEIRQSHHFRVQFPDLEKPRTLGDWLQKVPLAPITEKWEIPQADDFSKIIEFPLQVAAGFNDSGLMAGAFDFAERQSSYYRRANEQLGLVHLESGRYCLTEAGRHYIELSAFERQEKMIANLLQQPVVRFALEAARENPQHAIELEAIENSIAQFSDLSGQTVARRALTVRAWLRWLETALGELRIGNVVLKWG